MNASKILLSVAAFALLAATPAFATSETTAEAAPALAAESSIDTATAPATPDSAPAPSLDSPADAVTAPAETAPATIDTPAPVVDTPAEPTVATPETDATAPATTTEAAPAVEAPAEPVVEAPKPKPKKKKTPPAKLSALAKKYDLMSLDTNGDKSLSKEEFTANGFSNAKTFAAFDADHNGKLTNAEINAYAARIEANSKK